MAAGQGFEPGLLAEDLVPSGGFEAARGIPAGVGLRAEHHDVDQVVQPVDGMGHEQGVDRVERARRVGPDTGVDQVAVQSVAGQVAGEGHAALGRRERARVGDGRSVEFLPARFGAERRGEDLPQAVRGVLGEHLVVLGEFGGDLHPLGAHPSLGVGRADDRVLAVLVVQGAAAAYTPVGQRAGRGGVEAEFGLGRIAEPGDGHPLGGRIVGFQGEVPAPQTRLQAPELAVDLLVPAVQEIGGQVVRPSGHGKRHVGTS